MGNFNVFYAKSWIFVKHALSLASLTSVTAVLIIELADVPSEVKQNLHSETPQRKPTDAPDQDVHDAAVIKQVANLHEMTSDHAQVQARVRQNAKAKAHDLRNSPHALLESVTHPYEASSVPLQLHASQLNVAPSSSQPLRVLKNTVSPDGVKAETVPDGIDDEGKTKPDVLVHVAPVDFENSASVQPSAATALKPESPVIEENKPDSPIIAKPNSEQTTIVQEPAPTPERLVSKEPIIVVKPKKTLRPIEPPPRVPVKDYGPRPKPWNEYRRDNNGAYIKFLLMHLAHPFAPERENAFRVTLIATLLSQKYQKNVTASWDEETEDLEIKLLRRDFVFDYLREVYWQHTDYERLYLGPTEDLHLIDIDAFDDAMTLPLRLGIVRQEDLDCDAVAALLDDETID